jgi:Ras-related protein Rab-6A
MYYRDSHVAVLVFSVASADTSNAVGRWVESLQQSTRVMPALIIVGNKIDLERGLEPTAGDELAQKYNAIYVECSAVTRTGLKDLFVLIAEQALAANGVKPPQPETRPAQLDLKTPRKRCC